MFVNRKDFTQDKIVVDLSGPDGNAFKLIALAKSIAKQNGFDKDITDAIVTQMKSGDYGNLVNVLDSYFGSVLILIKD